MIVQKHATDIKHNQVPITISSSKHLRAIITIDIHKHDHTGHKSSKYKIHKYTHKKGKIIFLYKLKSTNFQKNGVCKL